MANRKNTNAAQAPAAQAPAQAPAAQAPAAQAPAQAPAATKYTVKLLSNGGSVQVSAANVAALCAATVNGKPVLQWAPTTTFAPNGPTKACKPTSYTGLLLASFSGQTLAQGVTGLVLNASAWGAVPPKYTTSYIAVQQWLQGGTHPGATHIVNCLQHVNGYVKGWLLKPAYGNHVVKQ